MKYEVKALVYAFGGMIVQFIGLASKPAITDFLMCISILLVILAIAEIICGVLED